MTDNNKILKAIDNAMEKIKTVDNNIIGETIGVSQALDELRKSIDEIEACMGKRTYTEASSLGYRDVSSAFIFLQRALGGLQHACNQKESLISEIAVQSGASAYEEVEPFVNNVLVSSKVRSRK